MRNKLFTSIVFIMLGLFYLLWPQISPHALSNKTFSFLGCFFILIALLLSFYSLKKLRTNKPGFFIDSKVLHDYSGVFGIGPILWRDVTQVKVRNVFWKQMIVIYVNNAQTYINNEKNWFKKIEMSLNHIFFDSPFCISTRELNITLTELFEEIDRCFKSNNQK